MRFRQWFWAYPRLIVWSSGGARPGALWPTPHLDFRDLASLDQVRENCLDSGPATARGETAWCERRPPSRPGRSSRHGLTDRTTFQIRIGMAASREVAAFVRRMGTLDAGFPERLKAGFVKEYQAHRQSGLSGDALFEAMVCTACRGFGSFQQQAAGIGVLVYLFEACEVFER